MSSAGTVYAESVASFSGSRTVFDKTETTKCLISGGFCGSLSIDT